MKRKLSLIMAVVMTLTMVFGYVGRINLKATPEEDNPTFEYKPLKIDIQTKVEDNKLVIDYTLTNENEFGMYGKYDVCCGFYDGEKEIKRTYIPISFNGPYYRLGEAKAQTKSDYVIENGKYLTPKYIDVRLVEDYVPGLWIGRVKKVQPYGTYIPGGLSFEKISFDYGATSFYVTNTGNRDKLYKSRDWEGGPFDFYKFVPFSNVIRVKNNSNISIKTILDKLFFYKANIDTEKDGLLSYEEIRTGAIGKFSYGPRQGNLAYNNIFIGNEAEEVAFNLKYYDKERKSYESTIATLKFIPSGADESSNKQAFDEVTKQLEELKKEIESIKTQIETLQAEKKAIEIKLTDAETAKEEAETNLQDKTKELEEANKKIAELEEKLKNAQAGDPADKETIKKLQDELNAEKAKVQDLENKAKELEEKIATLETEKKDLENKLTTADGKIKELEQQVLDKDTRIAELEAEIAEKDKTIAEKDEKIKSLEAEKQAKEAKINELTAELEKAKADLEQAGADKDKLTARIAELEAEIARLKAENENLNAEIEKLKAEIEALKGQVAEKDKTIADKDNTIADLNKKAEDLQKEIEDLKNHVDDLDALIAKLKAEKDGLTNEINKANEDLDNAKKDLEALKKELEDAKAKAETEKKALQDELNAEKAKLAELNKEIAKNEEDKKALQDELNTEKAKADADQNKIKELEGKIADKDNEKKALDNAKSELENKVAEKTTELEAKDKEIADLNTKIAEKEDAIKALEEKIAKLEAEKKDLEDKIKALLDKDTKKDDYIKELQDELEKIKKALEEAKAKEGIPSDKVAEDMKALQDQIAKLQKELEDAKKTPDKKDNTEDKKPAPEKKFAVSDLKDGDDKVEITLPDGIEAGDKVTVTKNGKKVGEKVLTNVDIKSGKTIVDLTERVKPGDTVVTTIVGKDGKEKASSFDGVRELTDAEVKARLKKLIDEARGIRNPSDELNKALDKAIDVTYDRYATINEYKWAIEDLERELDRIRHARNNRFKIELNAEPKVGDTKFEGTTQIKWYVDAFVNGKRVAYTQADARGNFTITLKEALKAGDKFRLFSVDPRNDDDYTEAEWKIDEDKKSDDKNSKVVITDEMLKGQGLDPKELVIFPVGQLFYNIVKGGEKTTVNMDARSYNDNGRVMMPMRYVAYAMGFNVEWDNNTREAVFTNNSNPVLPKRTIRVQIDTGKVYDTEGNVYSFDRKPINLNGRIHVSISNVAKAFGATTGYITDGVDQTIEWDQAKQAVYVFKYVK